MVYLVFLVLMGYPLLVCELAIGRSARTGIAKALPKLIVAAQPRTKTLRKKAVAWRMIALMIFSGNLALMMYYTDVCGWLLRYAAEALAGRTPSTGTAAAHFDSVISNSKICMAFMGSTVASATAICAFGVQRSIEKATKFMMIALIALLGALAAKSLTLPRAMEGLKFYLYPDWAKFMSHPWQSIYDALAQAFFTLSLGVGCMTIFGSYMKRDRTLASEAIWIIAIDTFVAFVSGLVIFPACATYHIPYAEGPGLVFKALPEVFAQMNYPAVWSSIFFVFLSLAALTTVIAVFECLIGGLIDETRIIRPMAAIIVGAGVFAASLPCVIGPGKVMEIEDFAVSKLYLPLGSLALGLFAAHRWGWKWSNFAAAANEGRGLKIGRATALTMKYILPPAIALVLLAGLAT